MRSGFVYVVWPDGGGLCKIGRTSNPQKRLVALLCGSPVQLLMESFETDFPQKVESRVHADLFDYRVRGEWFDVSVERAVAAVTLAVERNGEMNFVMAGCAA